MLQLVKKKCRYLEIERVKKIFDIHLKYIHLKAAGSEEFCCRHPLVFLLNPILSGGKFGSSYFFCNYS